MKNTEHITSTINNIDEMCNNATNALNELTTLYKSILDDDMHGRKSGFEPFACSIIEAMTQITNILGCGNSTKNTLNVILNELNQDNTERISTDNLNPRIALYNKKD